MYADTVRTAQEMELDAWKQFKVSPPVKMGAQPKDVADTRWAQTWDEAEGAKMVIARVVTKGRQDPDEHNGNVDIAG